MTMVAASGAASLAGDAVVLAAVLGAIALGVRHGFLLATLTGLHLLGGFVAALALARPLAVELEAFDCPATQSLGLAYTLIFAGLVLVGRLAVGALVTEEDGRLSPVVDRVIGGCIGCVAGLVLAGALLVGWSMWTLPESYRRQPDAGRTDVGTWVLRTFARCVERDPAARNRLLLGAAATPPAPPPASPTTGVSEPFVDANGNGICDEGERYLDDDGDGRFTPDLAPAGGQALDGTGRTLGLVDCYRLAAWRSVSHLHRPRITSATTVVITGELPPDSPLYRAAAEDPDADEVLTFGVKPAADTAAVAIDSATGVVVPGERPAAGARTDYAFTLIVTDKSGLADERKVTVTVDDRPESAPAR